MVRFGVPQEAVSAGPAERRVALVPSAVEELVREGHEVIVERGAGVGAGFPDDAYSEAGAIVAYQRAEVIARADAVVCVTRLMPSDLAIIAPNTPVLAFHQLGLAPKALRRQYAEAEVVAIGLDRLKDESGAHPVLAGLAELAGAMAPSLAARLLESTAPGRAGTLLGRLPGVAPTEVVVLGAGVLGVAAARGFAALGCAVLVLDADLGRLREVARELPANVATLHATSGAVARSVTFANVLVGAVRSDRERVPVIVSEPMVRSMRPGAVILDFAVSEGGCVATSRPIQSPDDAYMVHGVWHFTMSRTTSLVARTASRVISATALPFIKLLGTGVTPKAHRVFAPAIYFGEGLE